jgi:SAM-dependent methyltransferase
MLSRLLGSTPEKRGASNCPVCGESAFEQKPVLWDALTDAWQLSPEEVRYIDEQQGYFCQSCQCNLRSRTLAGALLEHLDYDGTLETLCRKPRRAGKHRILELNEAGGLSRWLRRMPHHILASYPEVDMQRLPYSDESWDLILHSDVLEHVPDPVMALMECRRVLSPRGALIYTIPIVYGRLTRSRDALPPSYHGAASVSQPDWLVHTEYGADFWLQPMSAGFRKVALFSLAGPQSLAIICQK